MHACPRIRLAGLSGGRQIPQFKRAWARRRSAGGADAVIDVAADYPSHPPTDCNVQSAVELRAEAGIVRTIEEAASQANSAWWWTPIIGLAGVLCGSMITAWFASSREQRARREESQRAALYELQEASLSARKALRTYGVALPSPTRELVNALDDATSRFEILQERLLCSVVRERATNWLRTARSFYTGDPAVTFTSENNAWTLLQGGVGEELRRLAS